MAARFRIKPPFYPIVYVRGYAMSGSERTDTFHDGYYGFGSTSVRRLQGPPDPDRYLQADVFEGQLVRFIKDFGYADAINRGNRIDSLAAEMAADADAEVRPPYRMNLRNPSRSLWISRFYDSDVLGNRLRGIEEHAADLLSLITEIIPAQLESCDVDLGPKRADYKVILLAHSMGGLVCRTVMQNLLPTSKLPKADRDPKRWIHRLVTMGTPHRGIDLSVLPNGVEQWLANTLNANDSGIFQPDQMRRYLRLTGYSDREVHSLGDPADPLHFPAKRCLCIVGSNYRDYSVANGLAKVATGSFSDGLVKQSNAYAVEGRAAPDGSFPPERTAFYANVHRAHSGYEGIVNSYESWENIHRFLFGDVLADVALRDLRLHTAPPDKARQERVTYDIEFSLSVKGTQTKLHERRQDPCENAMRYEHAALAQANAPIALHTVFLNSNLKKDASEPFLHFVLMLRVTEHRVREAAGLGGLFDKVKHLVGVEADYLPLPVYSETAEIRVGDLDPTSPGFEVQYRWASDAAVGAAWRTANKTKTDSGLQYFIELREANSLSGKLAISARRWPDRSLTLD
ncbi:hypothetical protein F0P96_06925 [Hymenobacter busanensis]|uniref:Uncharacterized protein n=1 Tax=Hymenobacter busanensis TaxID=2607656 RepID=A0A7L4ZZR7_9BACT|nr:hypothetical protein [Hymenobacter busanensis]KAA9338557.1 hypothetical protein F0P96_06925 [Hymenobacter busanensis]QHJ09014.1 hypothetical protein GUY19_17675 [Hymenobacter busanensis]